ncbi:hypothetical protein ACHQM5_013911 [Ranunculus cassubicifolius]
MDSGSGSGSVIIKTEDKKSQLRWNSAMDTLLIDMLVEAAKDGKKSGNKWNNDVWTSLKPALSSKAGVQVQDSHIDNRVRQMKKEYRNFKMLKDKSGSSYNESKQIVELSDDTWNELLSNPISSKQFKAFRDRPLKWDFEKLSIIVGNSHATGSYALNGLDDAENIDVVDLEASTTANESLNQEDVDEVSCGSTKATTKRQHGKRARYIDEVKTMFDGVNSNLEKLMESVDPLAFGRQLKDKVMKVDDFSTRYKNVAFKLLLKDKLESEVFILSDEEGRKEILEDLRSQIGDV